MEAFSLLTVESGECHSIRDRLFFPSLLLVVLTGASLWFRIQQTALWLLFWLPILGIVVLVGIEISMHDRSDPVPIGVLVIAVALVQILSLPHSFQLPDYDEYADLNFASTILSTGRWNPSLGVGVAHNYYGWYPAVHLVLSIWTIVAGTPLLLVMKYGAPVVMFIAVYLASRLVAKRVLRANPTYSTLLYVCSVGFMTIEPSRRTISLIIGLLFISLAFQNDRHHQSTCVTLLEVILATALAISDHFTAFVVLAASLCGIIILRLNHHPMRRTLNMIAFAFLAYFAWYIMIAVFVLTQDVTVLKVFLAQLVEFQQLVTTVGPSTLGGYGTIEKYLVFSAQIIFGTCAVIAIIARRKAGLSTESLVWGLLGFATMAGSAVLAFSAFHVLALTLYGYAMLPVAALSASTLHMLASSKKGTIRRILVLVLILVVLSGSMLTAFSARTLDYPPDQTPVLEEPREFTIQQLILGQWASANVPAGGELLGDYGSYVMLSGLYSLQFTHNFTWPANGVPDYAKSDFVLKGDCYFACPSGNWIQANKSLEFELVGYNQIFDDGTWQMMTAP